MLTQVTVQTAVLHVVPPTALQGVRSLCPWLPAPLSSMCGGGRQFRSHDPATFPTAAAYNLPHLTYLSQSCPWGQALHVDAFQSSSIGHPAHDLGLGAYLQDTWSDTIWQWQQSCSTPHFNENLFCSCKRMCMPVHNSNPKYSHSCSKDYQTYWHMYIHSNQRYLYIQDINK